MNFTYVFTINNKESNKFTANVQSGNSEMKSQNLFKKSDAEIAIKMLPHTTASIQVFHELP